MPRAQDATTWTPEIKRKNAASEGPTVWTRADRRDGSRPSEVVPDPIDPQPPAGVLMSTTFDEEPDWNPGISGSTSNSHWRHRGHALPLGAIAASSYNTHPPSTGGKWAIELSEGGSRSAGGKTLKLRRYSKSGSYSGDGQLVFDFPEGHSELFVKMAFRFQGGWSDGGKSKMLRIECKTLALDDSPAMFGTPICGLLWGYDRTSFGVRNNLTFAPRPFNDPAPISIPAQLSNGSVSLNFTTHPHDLNGDGTPDNDPQIPDLVNGGTLPDDSGFIAGHDNVYGEEWHEVAFYVAMNSAAGVPDGVMRQWLDGALLVDTNVAWAQSGGSTANRFNAVAIGGNDQWSDFPDEQQVVQEWFCDELLISTGLPQEYQ